MSQTNQSQINSSQPKSQKTSWARKIFHKRPLVMSPHQQARMADYGKFGNPLALIASFIFLVTWVISLIPTVTQEGLSVNQILFWISWLTLVGDYFTRVFLSGHPIGYIVRNPLGFLGAILPPFRLLYLVHAFGVVSNSRARLIAQASIGSVVVLFISIVVGAALVVNYEYGKPGSDIESYGDAIWWAFETVSTVGYGDFVPVTNAGRTVAVALMIVGVGLASVAAASVVSFLTSERKNVVVTSNTSGMTPDSSASQVKTASPAKTPSLSATGDKIAVNSTDVIASDGQVKQLSERISALESKIDQLISRTR